MDARELGRTTRDQMQLPVEFLTEDNKTNLDVVTSAHPSNEENCDLPRSQEGGTAAERGASSALIGL